MLNQLKWDVLRHLVYSPDLALSDYRCISSLKCDLGGRHFAMEEDPQSAIVEFAKQNAEWNSASIYKLISHYNKCFDEQGDHVEK